MRRIQYLTGGILASFLLIAASAEADLQNEDQQKCANTLSKSLTNLATAQGHEIYTCLKLGAKQRLDDSIESCLTADLKGKIARARAKTDSDLHKFCATERPDFGMSTASLSAAIDIVNEGAVLKELDLVRDLFGSDLDAVIEPVAGDKDRSECQLIVAKDVTKCQDAHLKAYATCKRLGLKSSIQDAAGLEACVGEDPEGKLAMTCSPADGKIARDLAKQCAEVDLAGAVPGCASSDPAHVAACLNARVRCRACSTLNAVEDLNRDCNVFDDGVANQSCLTGDILVLTYNVAGLPEGISGSNPGVNTPIIGPLLNAYELVLLQESWKTPDPNPLAPLRTYHEILEAASTHPFRSVPLPAPLGSDPDRPEALVSDGLNRFSIFPFEPVVRERWEDCDNSAADCLSLKGFSFARTTVAPGVEIDVYDLHMEAGNTLNDQQLREDDLNHIADFMETNSAGRPVLIGGDFNLNTDEEPDASQYDAFLARTGLRDVCFTLGCPDIRRIDKWAFRSSDSLRIVPLSWTVELDVFERFDGEPLSDHDAVAVRFFWEWLP